MFFHRRHLGGHGLVDLALEARIDTLRQELAVEASTDWFEFMDSLDLTSRGGRLRANRLLVRQSVEVFIGKTGYVVTREGGVLFGMDFQDGQPGFLRDGTRPKRREGEELHQWALRALNRMRAFLPATREAFRTDDDMEAASIALGEALDEGQRVGEY